MNKPSTPRNSWPVEEAQTYTSASSPAVPSESAPLKLFDVTCVIGSVYEGGNMRPRAAAFLLIAEQRFDGTYSFTEENGDTVTVTVAFTPPAH